LRVDLRIMVPVKTTKDQPVSKLERKLRDSAADVEPLELPDREHEPTDVDDVPPLSRVPAGVRELDPADQAAAAELRTRQRRGLLRQHALSREHKPNAERFLTWADLFERGLIRSKTQARRLWERAAFPKPVHLSQRVLAFRESEIEAWLQARMAERDGKAA